eukprot:13729837-Ditylum_brightwellii.AAC.1
MTPLDSTARRNRHGRYKEDSGAHHKDQKQINLVTTYRPCKQSNLSNSMVNAQQYRLLRQQGIQKPNPHNIRTKDLLCAILTWKEEEEVILLVDANSGLEDKELAPYVTKTGLYDDIRGMYGIDTPNIQSSSSEAIDFILCTSDAIQTM